jgi:arylsulfatase A-like enzyme
MKPPLIIVGPDIPNNKKNEGLVYLQDIMASSLDLAGIEKPDYVEFRSLMPLVKNKKGNYKSIYGAYLNLQRMVRVGDYKLIIYPEVPKAYLFNLKKDPQEMVNLADEPKYQNIKKRLFKELLTLQNKYKDTLDLTAFFE